MMVRFFHGWRRKLGCATFVLALLVCAAWSRTYFYTDYIGFPVDNRQHAFVSVKDGVAWIWSVDDGSARCGFGCVNAGADGGNVGQFMSAWAAGVPSTRAWTWNWFVPYQFVANLLIVMSAYLLLWEPRRTPKPATGA